MKRFLTMLLLAGSVFLLAGCGGETYGTGVDRKAPVVKVRDIFIRPDLEGKKVTVKGEVFTQCQSNGCWFVIQDDTGQVYIDLSRHQMTLPARLGRKATASGVVTRARGSYLLVGEGVVIK
ncbi:MAG: DNA-binding protein [Thermodesulfobacteriota bacterium]